MYLVHLVSFHYYMWLVDHNTLIHSLLFGFVTEVVNILSVSLMTAVDIFKKMFFKDLVFLAEITKR